LFIFVVAIWVDHLTAAGSLGKGRVFAVARILRLAQHTPASLLLQFLQLGLGHGCFAEM
jgi:hypothetical protein